MKYIKLFEELNLDNVKKYPYLFNMFTDLKYIKEEDYEVVNNLISTTDKQINTPVYLNGEIMDFKNKGGVSRIIETGFKEINDLELDAFLRHNPLFIFLDTLFIEDFDINDYKQEILNYQYKEDMFEFIMYNKYNVKKFVEWANTLNINELRFLLKNVSINKVDLKDYIELKMLYKKANISHKEYQEYKRCDIIAFIGGEKFKEVKVDGETYHKKQLYIENMVKVDQFSGADHQMLNMMKMRIRFQGDDSYRLYSLKVEKGLLDKYLNMATEELPDFILKSIDDNKVSI